MRIQYVNDLHMEFGHWPVIEQAGDVLCVAGDLCTWDTRDKGFMWLQEQAKKFDQVFFVPGNHEHYGLHYYQVVRDFWTKILAKEANIHYPEYAVEHDGVVFVGDTLWTDLNGGNPIAVLDYNMCMNDARWVFANKYMRENARQKEIIENQVWFNVDKPVVILTHHLPCKEMITAKWAGDRMNPAFANMDDWAENLLIKYGNIKMWHFGHTHDTIHKTHYGCKFVCNPYGYHGHMVNPEYRNALILEI